MFTVVLFLLFSIVLSIFVFTSNASIWLKIPTVAFLFYISSGMYFAFETYLSWPRWDQDLPDRKRYELISAYAVPPLKDKDGVIYVWVRERSVTNAVEPIPVWQRIIDPRLMFTYQANDLYTPRAFWMHYTEEMEEALQQGMIAKGEGASVSVAIGPANAKGLEGEEGEGSGDGSPENPDDQSLNNGGEEMQQYEKYQEYGVEIDLPTQRVKEPL
jgi:hypothetical protein